MDTIADYPEESKQTANTPILPPPPGLGALGIENPGTEPTEDTPLPDLLLYGLTPHGGDRPDLGIVLMVMNELEVMSMFTEGPLHTSLEGLARRLRVALHLASRIDKSARSAS